MEKENYMKSTELKFLANLAKQRLINKDYEKPQIQNKNKASSYFIENARALKRLKADKSFVTITDSIEEDFVDRVRKLLEEDCYNPLGELSDKAYFNALTPSQKEFYILRLSEKYNRVKDSLLA